MNYSIRKTQAGRKKIKNSDRVVAQCAQKRAREYKWKMNQKHTASQPTHTRVGLVGERNEIEPVLCNNGSLNSAFYDGYISIIN
jgi:hypothetical protein